MFFLDQGFSTLPNYNTATSHGWRERIREKDGGKNWGEESGAVTE